MHAPLTEFEAQVALAEMIVKLLAKEDSTKPKVSPLLARRDLAGVRRGTVWAFVRYRRAAHPDFPSVTTPEHGASPDQVRRR